MELRRVADEILHRLQSIPTPPFLCGGWAAEGVPGAPGPGPSVLRQISALEVMQALKGANVNLAAGSFNLANREMLLEVGIFFRTAQELADLQVGQRQGRAVYLRDVADVLDGPGEVNTYTRSASAPARPMLPNYRMKHSLRPDPLTRQ